LTVFRGRLFQFRIVRGKTDYCPIYKRVGGIWYERVQLFQENPTGGMIMSVFGIATSSCEILYNMTSHMGVTIQSDLKWDSHINNITTKANKILGFLRRNINISSTTVKEQVYKSLVRPSLEYACSVWDPYTKENIIQLEQVQRRAARYATNHYHNTSSVSNMLEHLNWRSLADRRSDVRLVMLYEISSPFTVFRGRLIQFRIVRGKNDCCLICNRVGGMRVSACSGRVLLVV
jgi:hypothetical protein